MLIVPIEEVRPGMRLAAEVLHPEDSSQVLLRRGFIIDDHVLARLRGLAVPGIYVDYPGLAELDRHLSPALSPERLKIYGQVKATIAQVQKRAQPSVGFADYYGAMRDFVITLFQQGDHPLYMEQISGRLGDAAVAHATAVAHLALVLGIKLRGYLMDQRKRLSAAHAAEVVNLGIAGMLHDIGKCKLPDAAADGHAARLPADPETCEAYQSHSRVGYEMVRNGIEASAAVAVLQHHQRFDGQGFPPVIRAGKEVVLAGEEIHVFARLVLVADLFDRLTHSDVEEAPSGGGTATRQVRTTGRPAAEVFRQMKGEYESWLDPVVFAALLRVVPPYPLGSRVKLTDGSEAVVVGAGVRDPYLPVVRRVMEGKVEEGLMDLGKEGMPGVCEGR